MFLEYYHLREQPFGVTPDPRFLYLSRTHREALASLYYGVDTGRGFMALISEPGMGKTTLLFQLLERLRKSACAAFLFQTQCDSRELLRYLLADMGVGDYGHDLVDLHAQLNQALVRISRRGMRFVLVIDEAQNLDNSVLETVRLLSDFETPSSKLIQIILSGQPQLADKLATASLVQLRQRIAILSQLEPFSAEESLKYIEHRLRIAGCDQGQLFTPEAKSMIAAQSHGIPRNINNLCFNGLSLGCALGRKRIDREIVLEAARDLDVGDLGKKGFAPHSEISHSSPPGLPRGARPFGGNGSGRRTFWGPTLATFLLLVGLSLFLPVRNIFRNSLASVWASILPISRSIELDHHTPQAKVPPMSTDSQNAQKDQASGALTSKAAQTVIVDVKARETLRQICVYRYGRFDKALLLEVLALNPKITDPNHIEVGQRVELPRVVRISKVGSTGRRNNMKPTVATGDKS